MSQSSLHQWALYYASRGWKVFPLKEHTPLPITQHGLHDATSDPAKINEWWSAWPNANIAVNLEASGLMAFDVDPQNGGDKTAAEHFPGLKSELTADTPSGGTHSIFSVPEGVEVPGRYGVGIDGKWKGYILLQPSYRKNFKDKPDGGYKWRPGFEGLPPALPEQLRKAPRVARQRIAIEHVGSLADVAEIQDCLASLDASYYEEQQWVHVGMALHHWESNTPDAEGVGFQLFDEWSSNDPDASRYVPHNIEVLWDRLNAGADGAITLGSLKHWAGKTAEQQHKASMSMARAAFAKMGAEELGKQWTTTSRDPMPCMLEPGEYTASVAANAPTAAYVQALNTQDWPRMIRILAYQFGSNCEKVLAELKQNPLFVETVELRDLIAVTCKATEKWASGSEATFAIIPEGVKMTTEKPLYGAEKQLQIFKGCAFVGNHGKIYLPDGSLYDQNAFNGFMPAGVYSIGDNETTKKPWDAFIYQLKFTNVRVHDLAFRPDLPPGAVFEDEGFRYINSFVPVPMRKVDADVTPFLDHLALMLPVERDREILLAYMAAVVQYPGTKFRWAPVIQGAEGNGKGLVMTVLQKAIGTRFFHLAQAADMGNKFNDWIVGKLLVGVSEMNIAAGGVDLIDSLKTMITDDYAAIQGKGQKQATARVFANFIFTTNRQGAVGKAASGRRYAVFYTAQQEDSDVARDMGNRYFLNLHKWLDQVGFMALNNYLSSYAIPDHLNPATECVTAPRTSSFAASVEESKGVIEQAIEEAVAEGRIGFREPFISSHFLGELMSKMNRGTAVGDKKRPALLAPLGYIPHPALNRGRATRHLIPDNKKIVLYVLKDHPAAQLNDKDAQARYELKNQPGLSDLINKSA